MVQILWGGSTKRNRIGSAFNLELALTAPSPKRYGASATFPSPPRREGKVSGRPFGFENWNLSFGGCGELSSHHALDEPFEQREPEEKMEARNLKDLS